jgi:hypothetical protein
MLLIFMFTSIPAIIYLVIASLVLMTLIVIKQKQLLKKQTKLYLSASLSSEFKLLQGKKSN